MNLVHIGLVSRSEEDADRFFGHLLGLEKERRSELPPGMAKELFGLDDGCEIVYYRGGDLRIEVFLTGWSESPERRISHVCLEVLNRALVLSRGAELGFDVRRASKGDSEVCFIEDASGNLFEIKEKQV